MFCVWDRIRWRRKTFFTYSMAELALSVLIFNRAFHRTDKSAFRGRWMTLVSPWGLMEMNDAESCVMFAISLTCIHNAKQDTKAFPVPSMWTPPYECFPNVMKYLASDATAVVLFLLRWWVFVTTCLNELWRFQYLKAVVLRVAHLVGVEWDPKGLPR